MLGYKKGNKKLLTGQIPLHYPADRVYLDGDTTKTVQDAVDKSQAMIATVQPNLTAVKAYAVGEQFVYNGLLYKVTTAISSGGTITINGNCELADSVTKQIGDCTKTSVESITFTYLNYGLWYLATSKFIVAVNDANYLITGGKTTYHRIYIASTNGITPVDPSESPLTINCVVQS